MRVIGNWIMDKRAPAAKCVAVPTQYLAILESAGRLQDTLPQLSLSPLSSLHHG